VPYDRGHDATADYNRAALPLDGVCHSAASPGRPHYGCARLDNLAIRKVYGRDGIRLLRCRSCQEEFSERRNTALFNTKVSEAKAEEVIDHLDEGCSVRSTSRLTKVAKATVNIIQGFLKR
jgi:transposase-like protein